MPPKRKAVEATARKAKQARGETDLQWDLAWHEAGEPVSGLHPLLVLSSPILPGRDKVAGFDIDFTIIATKSGKKFATGGKDWKWWDPSVPEKLKEYDADGYRIVFFTNQGGIEKNKVSPNEFRGKVEDIVAALDIPVITLASTGTNHFRKPATSMWDYFVEKCNQGVKVDKSKSIYVGDAAGRPKNWAKDKPKDFSCSDRMFAANIGISFHTPEEFFLGETPYKNFAWGSVNPEDVVQKSGNSTGKEAYHEKGTEMIIMVGPPASGKSSFSRWYLVPHGYVHVNRDTLHTPAKCMKAAEEALAKGKSVVVDNTSPSPAVRADYINIAKDAGVPCRCFYMQTSVEVAKHMNMVRMNQTNGEIRRIPDVGYNMYKKNFQEPTLKEGFKEIKKVDLVMRFDNKRDEELFKQWTT